MMLQKPECFTVQGVVVNHLFHERSSEAAIRIYTRTSKSGRRL